MRRIFLSAIFILAIAFDLNALSKKFFTVEGISYVSTDGKTVRVTSPGAQGYSGDIIIPSEVTYGTVTYSVAMINGSAFRECWGLTCIEIPNSVTLIGTDAFADCSGLTSIEIPNSVIEIDPGAFAGCSGLSSIDIPSSVKYIGHHAFAYCSGLTSIIIPNSVTEIGIYAFANCSSLTSIKIPNSVVSIGFNAFDACTSLSNVLWEADYCTVTGDVYNGSIFNKCPVSEFKFGDNVKTITTYCCSGLSNLTSIDIPINVTSIGEASFRGCTGLTSIKIPDNVKSIGNVAFGNCKNLKFVELSKNVTQIDESAFWNCSSLTSVNLPNSVTILGPSAFGECTGLEYIRIDALIPPVKNVNYYNDRSVFYGVDESVPIYIPCESLYKYKMAEDWNQFKNYNCIDEAEQVDEPIEEPIAKPYSNSVEITWPLEDGANRYVITITKGESVFCTLTFDSNGMLLNIEYAEEAPTTKSARIGNADVTISGYRYNITGLTKKTEYDYRVTVFDINKNVINSYVGTFTTEDIPTEIQEYLDIKDSSSLKQSVFINGKTISVERGDISNVLIFNIVGKQVANPVTKSGVYIIKSGDDVLKVKVP